MSRPLIDLLSPLGRRILAAQGVIESGQLANMRTLKLPVEPKIHVRVIGEPRTLCGRPLRNNDLWAWQFIHRGSVINGHPPSGSIDSEACKTCLASPVMKVAIQVWNARQSAFRTFKGRTLGANEPLRASPRNH